MQLSKWFYYVLGSLYFITFVLYLGSVVIEFDIANKFIGTLIKTLIPLAFGVIYLLFGFGKFLKNKFIDWSVILGLLGIITTGLFYFSLISNTTNSLKALGTVALFSIPLILTFGSSVILLIIGLIERKEVI